MPEGIYLAAHSIGAMSVKGETYLERELISPWKSLGYQAWDSWLPLIDRFCGALSGLLGGTADEYCPQPNLSAGFYKYLTSLPCRDGRNQILMHETAFPSLGFVAAALKAQGLSLKLISKDMSADDPEVWEKHIGEQTLCSLITHVHSNTGVLSPVGHIAKLCQDAGAYAALDVAQSAGIIPMDITEMGVDAVFGSCVKWLCGGPGAGFMWVNGDQLSELSPDMVGWFSHENPFEFDIGRFAFNPTAKRFWGGTPSVAPYAHALGGIETIAGIGAQTIRAHNVKLMRRVSPDIDPTKNGGTLCLNLSGNKVSALREAGCHFDNRGETARLSFHIYNTEDDADIVGSILRS